MFIRISVIKIKKILLILFADGMNHGIDIILRYSESLMVTEAHVSRPIVYRVQ